MKTVTSWICLSWIFLILLFQRLYELGARRVLVTGTGPLGCVPAELAMRSTNGQCAPDLQRAAALYNPQLEQMLGELNSEYGDDIFIAVNTRQMTTDFISNPRAFGTSFALSLFAWKHSAYIHHFWMIHSLNVHFYNYNVSIFLSLNYNLNIIKWLDR